MLSASCQYKYLKSNSSNMSATGRPKEDRDVLVGLTDIDILMGRGRRARDRGANRRLRMLAEAKALDYSRLSSQKEKRQFARQFIAEVQSNGARFLQAVTCNASVQGSFQTMYVLVPSETVEIKIKQLLRDRAQFLVEKRERGDSAPSNSVASPSQLDSSLHFERLMNSSTQSPRGNFPSMIGSVLPYSNLEGGISTSQQLPSFTRAQLVQQLQYPQGIGVQPVPVATNPLVITAPDLINNPSLQYSQQSIEASDNNHTQPDMSLMAALLSQPNMSFPPGLPWRLANLDGIQPLQHPQQQASGLVPNSGALEESLVGGQPPTAVRLPTDVSGDGNIRALEEWRQLLQENSLMEQLNTDDCDRGEGLPNNDETTRRN